jgi:hypothetical protein
MDVNIRKVEEEDIDTDNAILLCMPYGYETVEGSLTGECCECGRKIVFAPSAPAIPKKLCLPCGLEAIEKVKQNGENVEIGMTEKQRVEVNDHFKKHKEKEQ